MEGKRMIMLGSNNYLGFTEDPVVVEAGIKALEKYGTGCSGSRFLNGTLDLHLQLEKELAEKSIHAKELERDMETLRDRIILLKEIIHSLYDIGKEAKITLPHLPEDLLEDDADYLD